jgi:hypothetical protein
VKERANTDSSQSSLKSRRNFTSNRGRDADSARALVAQGRAASHLILFLSFLATFIEQIRASPVGTEILRDT